MADMVVTRARANIERDRRDLFGSDQQERLHQQLNDERKRDMQEFLEKQRSGGRGQDRPKSAKTHVVNQRQVSSSALSLNFGGSEREEKHRGKKAFGGSSPVPSSIPKATIRNESKRSGFKSREDGEREQYRTQERRYQEELDGDFEFDRHDSRSANVGSTRSYGENKVDRHYKERGNVDEDDIERQLTELQELLRERRREKGRGDVGTRGSRHGSPDRDRSSHRYADGGRGHRTDNHGEEYSDYVRDSYERSRGETRGGLDHRHRSRWDDVDSRGPDHGHSRRHRRATPSPPPRHHHHAADERAMQDGDSMVRGRNQGGGTTPGAGRKQTAGEYAEELRRQIAEKEERKRQEKNARRAPPSTVGAAAMQFGDDPNRDRRHIARSVAPPPSRGRAERAEQQDRRTDVGGERGVRFQDHGADARDGADERWHATAPSMAPSQSYAGGGGYIPIPYGAGGGGGIGAMGMQMGGVGTAGGGAYNGALDPVAMFPALFSHGMNATVPAGQFMMPMGTGTAGGAMMPGFAAPPPLGALVGGGVVGGHGVAPHRHAYPDNMHHEPAPESRSTSRREVAAVDSTYDPFGRGGAGAPLKDGAGNVIADYRALARGDASPDATDRRARTMPTQLTGNAHTPGNPQTGVSGGVWGAAEPAPAQHAPGGATGSGASPQHYARTTGADGPGPASQAERDHESSKKQQTYQEFLREQMEEKERLKQAQKAKEKAEEAREAARLEEERKKLQAIYEAEQAKQREKEERIREENAARQRDAAAKKQFADEERRRRREEEEAQREEVKREELDRALRDKLVSPSVARVQGAAPSSPPLTTREGAQSPPVGGDAEGGAAMQSPYVPVARVPSPPIPTMRKSAYNPEEDPFNQKGAKVQRDTRAKLTELRRSQELGGAEAVPQMDPLEDENGADLAPAAATSSPHPPPTGTAEASAALSDAQRTLQQQLDEQQRVIAQQQHALATQQAQMERDRRRALDEAAHDAPPTTQAHLRPDSARNRPESARSRPQSSRSRPQSSRSRVRTSRPLSSRNRPNATRATAPETKTDAGPTVSQLDKALHDYEHGQPAVTATSTATPTQAVPPVPSVPVAVVPTQPRREKTVELEDPPEADLHDSVHDRNTPSSLSASHESHPIDVVHRGSQGTRRPTGDVDAEAKEQLMGQLHSLRKRLEGEQKKVQSDIRANSAQYSKLASQARLRTKQNNKSDEVNAILANALKQVEEFKQLPGARIRLDTQNNTEAAHTGLQSKPVFVRTRANPWGPTNTENADTNGVDDDSLKQFAKLKLTAYPEPPQTFGALDQQQQALLEAQERDLDHLRAVRDQPVRSGGGAGGHGDLLGRTDTALSFASFSSLNVDALTARNNERLRRLHDLGTTSEHVTDPNHVLDAFLHRESDNTDALLSPTPGRMRVSHRTGASRTTSQGVALPNDSQFKQTGTSHSTAIL